MKATYVLPTLPLAAAAAGTLFLVAMRFRRMRWAALAFYALSVPALAVLAYRFWDHHVGPEEFCFWQFAVTPAALSFLMPLAAVSPLLLWSVQVKGAAGKRDNAVSALASLGLGAAMAAAMSQHLYFVACMSALASWSLAGTAVLKGRKAARLLPCVLPLAASDFCLALGLFLFYMSDRTRGLFFPPSPLKPTGMLAASCTLLLAAALMRLGCFPLQGWMGGISRGGRELRLLHIAAVDLTLGALLLYCVSRVFFVWDGPWVWICLGIAALSLLETGRELLHVRGGDVAWGLLCASCGAAIALTAAPGGQAAAAASRLTLWAAVPALALVALGSGHSPGLRWAGVVGSASLMGLPPLAGFACLWMGLQALAGKSAGGETVIFLAAVPLLFTGALVSGSVAVLMPRGQGGERALAFAGPCAVLLAACCAAVGLYPGAIIDLVMREYGLHLDIPFAAWTSLGWAVLISAGLVLLVASAWTHRWKGFRGGVHHVGLSLPLLPERRPFPLSLSGGKGIRASAVCGVIALYAAWIGFMIFLGIA